MIDYCLCLLLSVPAVSDNRQLMFHQPLVVEYGIN